jgi:hypothetical protein
MKKQKLSEEEIEVIIIDSEEEEDEEEEEQEEEEEEKTKEEEKKEEEKKVVTERVVFLCLGCKEKNIRPHAALISDRDQLYNQKNKCRFCAVSPEKTKVTQPPKKINQPPKKVPWNKDPVRVMFFDLYNNMIGAERRSFKEYVQLRDAGFKQPQWKGGSDLKHHTELYDYFFSCKWTKFENPFLFKDYDNTVKSMLIEKGPYQVSIAKINRDLPPMKANITFVPLFMNGVHRVNINDIRYYIAYTKGKIFNPMRSLVKNHIARLYYNAQLSSSKRKGEAAIITITRDHILNKLIEQNGYCVKSGLWMNCEYELNPFQMSLDRIDNRKGYIPENIRLVCLFMNFMERVTRRAHESDDEYEERYQKYHQYQIKYDLIKAYSNENILDLPSE